MRVSEASKRAFVHRVCDLLARVDAAPLGSSRRQICVELFRYMGGSPYDWKTQHPRLFQTVCAKIEEFVPIAGEAWCAGLRRAAGVDAGACRQLTVRGPQCRRPGRGATGRCAQHARSYVSMAATAIMSLDRHISCRDVVLMIVTRALE
jgi:hypothetical protein